jgi:hypothetical protein
MALTRFYDRESGGDGPVSGALQVINLSLDTALATDTTVVKAISIPAGMQFEITDIKAFCGTVTAASTGVTPPQINVGATAAGTQIVAQAVLVTGANALTIKNGSVAANGTAYVRIVSATNSSAAAPVSVNVVGYVFAPPSSVPVR